MRDTWEIRFEWIQSTLQWISLVTGVGLSVLATGATSGVITAAVAVASYTIAMQAIPQRQKNAPLVGALLALLGVATSLFAVSLTGGIDSPFLLYLAVPVFFASAFHGMILGGVTTLAAIAGLLTIATTSGGDPLSPTVLLMVGFYALIGITFSQARRILIEEPRLEPGTVRFARLESAHQLLSDLAELASTAELNPITIGRSALRDLAATVPFEAGAIAIFDGDDRITVATRGRGSATTDAYEYPIALVTETLGLLRLWPTPGAPLDSYQPAIVRATRAVALAFDNVVILQSIARRAVREERIRLARELHDDIGPSLVSIGLGLDLAMQQGGLDPELASRLTLMRETIGELVNEVRAAVSNLRGGESPSLLENAELLASEVPVDGPALVVALEEIGPPPARDSEHLVAIMTEAVRNAVEHANADIVRIDGSVARGRGSISIADNGSGIRSRIPAEDRYGLIGMQERAEEIGGTLEITTAPGRGTTVTVRWGPT